MQGVHPRFPSKKALREAIAAGSWVSLEATSLFGNEYDGALEDAPDDTYPVVGTGRSSSRTGKLPSSDCVCTLVYARVRAESLQALQDGRREA